MQYIYTMIGVSKIVPPKREIIKDISLSFFPGAKIGVLGLNGSGKSTLLKIMAGIDKEIEGEATPMPNLKIGYLPQEPQLDPEQNVRESVVAVNTSGPKRSGSSLWIAFSWSTRDFAYSMNVPGRRWPPPYSSQ